MKIRQKNLEIAKKTTLRLGILFSAIPFIAMVTGSFHLVNVLIMAAVGITSLYATDHPVTKNFSLVYGFSAVAYTSNGFHHSLGNISIPLVVIVTLLLSEDISPIKSYAKILFPILTGEFLLATLPDIGKLAVVVIVVGVAISSALVSFVSDKISIREFFSGSMFSDLLYVSSSYLGYAYSPLFGLIVIGLILNEQKGTRVMLARDMVSGLANYEVFIERIEKCKDKAIDAGVIVFSISNYQEIINQLGISFGDRVIREVAKSVKTSCRKKDLVSRLSGDVFGICVQASHDDLSEIVNRIASNLNGTSFKKENTEVYTKAKFGVAIVDPAVTSASKIIDFAYLAARRGNTSTNNVAFFDEMLDIEGSRKIDLISEIPRAIKKNEFFLVYQPKVELHNRLATGVEALIRWNHPTQGVVMPDQFIPSAEQTEIIKPLSMWVVKEALSQISIWRSQHLDLQVAVNVSFANLLDPNFALEVVRIMKNLKLPPRSIEIEITENVGAVNSPVFFDSIHTLRSNGIPIALDDFGTGYSSLSYVSQIQADTIKIDKEFVRDLCSKRESAVIVKSILDLAKEFGYTTVAEGVENEEVLLWLQENGCSIAQGYFISKPLSSGAIPQWINAFNKSAMAAACLLERNF